MKSADDRYQRQKWEGFLETSVLPSLCAAAVIGYVTTPPLWVGAAIGVGCAVVFVGISAALRAWG